jgi:hypothetical protein
MREYFNRIGQHRPFGYSEPRSASDCNRPFELECGRRQATLKRPSNHTDRMPGARNLVAIYRLRTETLNFLIVEQTS